MRSLFRRQPALEFVLDHRFCGQTANRPAPCGIDGVLDVLRRPREPLVAIAGAGGGHAARLARLIFDCILSKHKAFREGNTHDIRSGIVCEGSGNVPKGDRRQLHGPRASPQLASRDALERRERRFCLRRPRLRHCALSRYIGIDISKPSLDVARDALSTVSFPVELRCQDFVEAIDTWEGPLDVVWIGQSLQHLHAWGKRAFMRKVERLLPRDGLFLIWEPTRFEGEDREGWLKRFCQIRPEWSAISDEEFAAFDSHHRASDYAETSATWKGMAREAGFDQAEEIFTVPNQLARVYLFRH
jgi:SAM-dependent methyltransferase